jgi:transposase
MTGIFGIIQSMEEILAELKEIKIALQLQAEENAALRAENKLLREKVKYLLKKMFGAKSEKLSDDQLMLMLGMQEASIQTDDQPDSDDDTRPSGRKRGNRESKPRLPADLPTEDIVIEPDEVKQNPSGYRKIGEEITEELDVTPTQYFRRRIIRPKYVSRTDKTLAPVIAELPARMIEGGYASAGLVADIIVKKYADHLPLYRQEQIIKSRHGIDLSRQTMCEWVEKGAFWLKMIYDLTRNGLKNGGYLQVDETPVKYCSGESGGSGKGYLWVYHRPGGDVLFEWHTSRAAKCLDTMLSAFKGVAQTDGYSAYKSYADDHKDIVLSGCWAHSRRKFHEAEGNWFSGWVMKQVRYLYEVEKDLKKINAGPRLKEAVRGSHSRMVADRLGKLFKLKLQNGAYLPSTKLGEAIAYAVSRWDQLMLYIDDGRLEIDNNPVENAIRPTAVGKKNWLFIGHPEAGERAAIIYTILACCKRHGINPQEYLQDVFTRIPSMKSSEISDLLPANWLALRRTQAA